MSNAPKHHQPEAMPFVRVLRQAMAERNLAAADVARAIGVSTSAVRHVLMGYYLPTPTNAARYAKALRRPGLLTIVLAARSRKCRGCEAIIVDRGSSQRRIYCNSRCRRRHVEGVHPRPNAERLAIEARCRQCEPKGRCYDGECALRRYSPFPLIDDLIIVDDPRPNLAWNEERRRRQGEMTKARRGTGRHIGAA